MSNPSQNYRIIPTPNFLDEASKLLRKYPNIKQDFLDLANVLKQDPITGNDNLGSNLYKVRMKISDNGKGQSGGARVIINVLIVEKEVYVLSAYDKSTTSTISERKLDELLKRKLAK